MTSTTGLSLSKDFSNLNQDEYTQVKEELRLSRNILQNQNTGQRIPYLPTFSGDGGIALEHYISAIEAVKPTHSSHLLAQAIRKSVTGTAAKVINILDYTTPLSELISELKKNFQKVTGIATAWQKFYSASQTSKESLPSKQLGSETEAKFSRLQDVVPNVTKTEPNLFKYFGTTL